MRHISLLKLLAHAYAQTFAFQPRLVYRETLDQQYNAPRTVTESFAAAKTQTSSPSSAAGPPPPTEQALMLEHFRQSGDVWTIYSMPRAWVASYDNVSQYIERLQTWSSKKPRAPAGVAVGEELAVVPDDDCRPIGLWFWNFDFDRFWFVMLLGFVNLAIHDATRSSPDQHVNMFMQAQSPEPKMSIADPCRAQAVAADGAKQTGRAANCIATRPGTIVAQQTIKNTQNVVWVYGHTVSVLFSIGTATQDSGRGCTAHMLHR